MSLVLVAFFAGVLTIGAPCILPLLPVIIGGTAISGEQQKNKWLRPLVVTGSLVTSVVVFTLLLKFSTSLLGVPQEVWQYISGGIILLLGATFVWPILWEKLPIVNKFNITSNKVLAEGYKQKSLAGDVVMGAALGPVFNSCSPTYLFIVAAILPATFATGLAYLIAYALGLGLALLLLAIGGQRVVSKLGWLSNSDSVFKKIVGGLFIIVGLAVIFGLDKQFQTFVLDQGWYNPLSSFEESLRQ